MQLSIRIVKRFMDMTLAAGGLVVAAPVMGFIAAAIRASSPGPVIYTQRRAGMIHGEEDKKTNRPPTTYPRLN